jgi:hypothetical protein
MYSVSERKLYDWTEHSFNKTRFYIVSWFQYNSVPPEPAGSSLYLQEVATGPYPEPSGATPHPPAYLPNIHSGPIISSTSWSSKWSLSHQTPAHFPLISHACQMSRPSHSPSKSKSRYDWRPVKHFILVSSPLRAHDQIFVIFLTTAVFDVVGRPLWREFGCYLSRSLSPCLCPIFTRLCAIIRNMYNIYEACPESKFRLAVNKSIQRQHFKYSFIFTSLHAFSYLST